MSRAGIVVFTTRGVVALRAVLHGIRETVDDVHELVVFAPDAPEQVATYLTRQYLRGRITGLELDTDGYHGSHCGLDLAYHLVGGDYLVRVDDTLEFRPGWLDRAIAALEADPSIGLLSLVQPPGYHRGRGRPRSVNFAPEPAELLDMRCFVTRRDLVIRHECELMGEQAGDECLFQRCLVDSGRRLVYMPGLVTALDLAGMPLPRIAAPEAELPAHGGATGSIRRLRQRYELGDDVLSVCMACSENELEVLAARVKFCSTHQAAIGHMYELRCPECGELHYKDDFQFRCPR